MKRYACHRLYKSLDHYEGRSFVSLNDEGIVMETGPLTEEMAATEWIGGVIILSGKSEIPYESDVKSKFFSLLSGDAPANYAWHISTFDFQQGEPFAGSVIRQL